MKKKYVVQICLWSILFFFGTLCVNAPAAEVLKGKSVNINTATVEELVKNVPTMTLELAKNIVKYRKENGDFQQKEELLQVPGMNRTLLKKWDSFFILEGIGGKDCTC
ncbi:MAG TPA: helix-hairpin-helix domain-containing protein [Geobacteraceae bacterium]|nr:helix-hairpin-helix domain-containing protein [Geobacteraceae bacterium]